jgi:DNA ligase-1
MKLPILYARSTTGKVSQWEIEYNDHAYRTISGFTDGKKITSEWTDCKGKSYNTTAEQTEKQAKALWKKKKESGMFEALNEIDNDTFFEPMLAKDYHDYLDKIDFKKHKVFIQPKLDGVRMINKSNRQFSRNGKEFLATPHLNQNEVLLDGEMYNHTLRDNFNEIISLCRKTKPTTEDIKKSAGIVEYWIYDFPQYKGVFSERYKALQNWMLLSGGKNPKFKLVPTFQVFNLDEIENFHIQFLSEGFEGSIIRIDSTDYENKRSKSLLKKKDEYDAEFEIIGVLEGKGKLTGKVGKLVFNGFDSAVNGSHEYLEELWDNRDSLIGKKATIKYFNLTPDGIPRFLKVIAIRDYE